MKKHQPVSTIAFSVTLTFGLEYILQKRLKLAFENACLSIKIMSEQKIRSDRVARQRADGRSVGHVQYYYCNSCETKDCISSYMLPETDIS